MKFETFWNSLKKDLIRDKEFQTLKQHKDFTARFIEGIIKVFPNSTMSPRNISQEEFLKVWNQAKNYNRGEQFVIQNYIDITRNGSYIIAIFRHYLGENEIE